MRIIPINLIKSIGYLFTPYYNIGNIKRNNKSNIQVKSYTDKLFLYISYIFLTTLPERVL